MSVVRVTRWRDLLSWAPPSAPVDAGDWPLVSLAQILRPIAPVAYQPSPGETVRFAGVRWYGKGVFVREERPAENVAAKCFPLIPGALVYNRLFGWKSAFALVGEEMSGVVVSNEFPQFAIVDDIALPAYINLVCGAPTFARVMLSRSTGSTAVSRNRLHVDDLLDLEIPLPGLDTQAQIVAEFEDKRTSVARLSASAESRRVAAQEQFLGALGVATATTPPVGNGHVTVARFAALSRWDVQAANATVLSQFPLEALEAHADIRLGCQVTKRGANPRGVERPYLRAANVQRGHLALSEVKTMRVSQSQADSLRLLEGDLLFLEGSGSVAEIGRCALWEGQIVDCIHQNSVVRARIRSNANLDARFAVAWFNTDLGSAYFREQATTTSGLFHIGAGKTGKAPIPIPPPELQKQLAEAYWDDMSLAAAEDDEAESLGARAVQGFAAAVFGAEATADTHETDGY